MAIEHEKFLVDLLRNLPKNNPDRPFLSASLELTRAYIEGRKDSFTDEDIKNSRGHSLSPSNLVAVDGARIKELRIGLGLSQLEVARPAGLTRSRIAKLEGAGVGRVRRLFVQALARSLQTTEEALYPPKPEE